MTNSNRILLENIRINLNVFWANKSIIIIFKYIKLLCAFCNTRNMVYTFILCLIITSYSYYVDGNISNHIIVLLTQQLSLLEQLYAIKHHWFINLDIWCIKNNNFSFHKVKLYYILQSDSQNISIFSNLLKFLFRKFSHKTNDHI